MTTLRALCALLLLSMGTVACDDKKEAAPEPTPTQAAVDVPASVLAPTPPSSSSGPVEQAKGTVPEKLADGPGLGKVIALHEGYVYWTMQAGFGSSSSDGRIVRLPKDGGVPQEVAGGLDNVDSLAFDAENVFWTMCGMVDHVQRCRVTGAPLGGGKRTLVFDAGPDLVASAAWAGGLLLWAEPGKNRVQKSDTKQSKPSPFAQTGDVTDMTAQGDAIFWSEGRALAPEGAIKRAAADGTVTTVSKGRRFPRHLAVDGDRVFWVESAESEAAPATQMIMSVDVGGGEPKIIAKDLPHVDGIAVAATRVVVVAADAVSWVPKAGGASVVLASGLKSPAGPAADETHAYWISGDKVWRIAFQP